MRTSFEVILSPILKANIPLERSSNFLNEDILFVKIQSEMAPLRSFEVSRRIDVSIDRA